MVDMEDDDRVAKNPEHVVGEELSTISVDELRERVGLLKTEIARLEAEIAEKGSSRSAADANFWKGLGA